MLFARVLTAGLVAALLAACGGAPVAGAGDTPPGATEIARVHRTRCGACHLRVEPGERSRAELEAALAKHRKRVPLREEQWSEMIDYLAAAPSTAANAPSR